VSLRILILSLLVSSSTALGAEVKVVNPSFEEEGVTSPEGRPDWVKGPAGWRVWYSQKAREAGAKAEWDKSVSRTGKRSVVLRGCAGTVCVLQNVPVTPGRSYICYVWARRSNPRSACYLGIRWLKADKSWQSANYIRDAIPAHAPPDKWVRIAVPFTAPKDAAYAVIMLSASEQSPDDRCWFDDVEMRQLARGCPPVLSFNWMHRNLFPVGEPIETPHIAWGKPLAGGKIRALFLLREPRNLREPFELAQRLDIDFDYLIQHRERSGWFAFNHAEVQERLEANYYDVIVLSATVGNDTLDYLLKHSKGLLVLSGWQPLPKSFGLAEIGEGHPVYEVTDALPDVISIDEAGKEIAEPPLKKLLCGTVEGKRVVRVLYAKSTRCLTPNFDFEYHLRTAARYYEAYLQLLARAMLWAAGRESPVRISVSSEEGGFAATVSSDTDFTARLETVFADRLDEVKQAKPRPVSLKRGGKLQFNIAAPMELASGAVTCFATLRDVDGKVVGFAAARTRISRPASIISIEPQKPFYEEGEKAAVMVELTAGAKGLALRGALRDAFGRIHARDEAVVKGEAVKLSFDTSRRLSAFSYVDVELLKGGKAVDRARSYILVPFPREKWLEEYQVGTWNAATYLPAYIQLPFHKLLREVGVTEGLQGLQGFLPMLAAGLMPISTTYCRIPAYQPHDSDETVRKPCFSDPEIRRKMADMAREIAADELRYRPLFGYLRDETSLVKPGRDVDVCSCEHCQRRYRKWLKEKYRSLDNLNAAWGTKYSSWNEIGFVTYKQVRGKRTFAPWVMYRSFMDWAWAEGVRWVKENARKGDAGVMLALANTFGPNPFSGRDYYLLCHTNDYWMEYATETRTPYPRGSMRYDFDAVRCFNPNLKNHPWVGYRFEDEAITFGVWWTALHGAAGVSPYGALSMAPPRGSWALIFPTLQHTRRGQLYAREIGELKSGIGKLLMNSPRVQAPIAILWSQRSMYVAWAMSDREGDPRYFLRKTDCYSQFFLSRQNFRRSVLMSGRQFDYVCEEQILKGVLKNYRCLVLPAAYAVSKKVAQALREFVSNGGTLIADMGCGIANDVGRIYEGDSPAEELFGFKRRGAALSYEERTSRLPLGEDGKPVELSCVGWEEIEPLPDAACVLDKEGRVAYITRKIGNGKTIFLNCSLPDSPQTTGLWRDLPRIAQVTSRDGSKHPTDYELVLFESGDARYLGVLHHYLNHDENYPVRLKLNEKSHIYDIREGKYLGEGDSIDAEVAAGNCKLFALLPYRVKDLSLDCGEATRGENCRITCEVRTDAGTAGTHVLHLDVFSPDGKRVEHYSSNAIAREGKASFEIPFALNDAAGEWTVVVRDVATGVKSSAKFILR